MITSRWLLLSVSVIATLVSSTAFVAIPTIPSASAQQKVLGANWEWVWFDAQGSNYSPQTQITKDNAQFLELKWVYPFPLGVIQGEAGIINPAAAVQGGIGQGFAVPPLVVNGVIYTASQRWDVFAINAATGKEVWRYSPKLALPPNLGARHIHSLSYADGKIIVTANTNGYGDVFLLDALTGKEVLQIADIVKDIPGQRFGDGRYGYGFEWAPSIYKKGNILIVQGATIDFITRGFIAGYDLNTGRLLWRWYSVPPAPDCKWEPKQANDARKGNIDPALAVGDWGTRCDLNGAAGVWGYISVDEETGRAYFGTSGPYTIWNATYRPGPNLYGAIIGALDAMTGDLIWYYQTTTHDIHGEQDCKEGTMLIKGATVQGQKRNLVWNLCRSFVYILDADTGKLVYSYDRWQKEAQGANPRKNPESGHNMGNGMNMKTRWWQEPKVRDFDPYFGGNGGYAAYDPNTNAIFFKSTASAQKLISMGQVDILPRPPTFSWPVTQSDPTISRQYPSSTEIVAMDLNTGRVKWKRDFGDAPTRLNVVVTGGMVWGGVADGVLRAMDAETGKDLWTKAFGTISNQYAPTFGATGDGKITMFYIFGGSAIRVGVPGALMALGLPDKLPEPQVITKEVVKEVVKEVPKEVIKEVVKEVPKEVVKEVIKEVTKTVTVETVSPVSYAAIGISIVILVVAGVLFTRRKKA